MVSQKPHLIDRRNERTGKGESGASVSVVVRVRLLSCRFWMRLEEFFPLAVRANEPSEVIAKEFSLSLPLSLSPIATNFAPRPQSALTRLFVPGRPFPKMLSFWRASGRAGRSGRSIGQFRVRSFGKNNCFGRALQRNYPLG